MAVGYSAKPISTANGNIDYDGKDSWYRYGYAGQQVLKTNLDLVAV